MDLAVSQSELREWLAATEPFSLLDRDRLSGLAGQIKSRRLQRGDVLMLQGDPASRVYFLASGRAKVLVTTAAGSELSIRDIPAGSMTGELSILDPGTRSATVIAASDGLAYFMDSETFRAVLTDYPSISSWLLSRLARQIRELTAQLLEFATMTVPQRVHSELARLALAAGIDANKAIVDPAPSHAEIASRIGTHREAVSKEVNHLERRGIVESGRRKITILNVADLLDLRDHAMSTS